MDCHEFTRHLSALTAEEILRVAAAVRADLDTADGEVAWWRATVEVTGTLRRHHRRREASLAAHRAAAAVLAAAHAAGIDDDAHRADVTAVARAASEAARVLVACESGIDQRAIEALLHPWAPAHA